MKWHNIKQKYPKSNSEVIALYYMNLNDDDNYGSWCAEVIHEKALVNISEINNGEIYWTEMPDFVLGTRENQPFV